MTMQQTFLNNKNKIVSLRTNNNFKYRGKILDCSEDFLKLFDFKTQTEISLKLNFIVEFYFEKTK